jgi:hypothetical protein
MMFQMLVATIQVQQMASQEQKLQQQSICQELPLLDLSHLLPRLQMLLIFTMRQSHNWEQ